MIYKVGDGLLDKKTGEYLIIEEVVEFEDGDHRYICTNPDHPSTLDADNWYTIRQLQKYTVKSAAVGLLYGKE